MALRMPLVVVASISAAVLVIGVPGNPRAATADSVVPAPAGIPEPADTAAARVFEIRCAECHVRGAGGYAPSLDLLAARSPEAIVESLTTGTMRFMADGLSAAQIGDLASFLSASASAAADGSADDASAACTTPAPPLDLAAPSWNGWGFDQRSSRYQPEPGFGIEDVPYLRVKWAFAYPTGDMFAQPSVVGDWVFVSSVPGEVYALDAATGCIRWSAAAGTGSRTAVSVGPLPASAAPARFAAYVAANNGTVHALNAETGESLWSTRVVDHPIAVLTGSPVLHEDRLFVPVSSIEEAVARSGSYECCTFRGKVVTLDAYTGDILWKGHAIKREPEPFGTTEAGATRHGPAGAAIWSAPTVDPARRLVYAGTGNSYTAIDNAGSNAVVAFDMDTGELRWRVQATEGDNFVMGCGPVGGHANCPEEVGPDWDFGQPPILRTLPDGRELLVIGQKSGVVWGLDPDRDGEVVWETRIGAGGALGGIQWGSAADEHRIYVPISDVIAAPARRRPGVSALDIVTGEELWHTPGPEGACSWGRQGCSNSHSAPATAIPGAVFAGSLDGHIRAFSSEDGTILWSFDTGRIFEAVNGGTATGGSIDTTGPVIVNGTLFHNSGYGRFTGRPGNVLLAFTVDGR